MQGNVLARRLLAYGVDVLLLFAVLGPLGFAAARVPGVDASTATGPQVWLAAVLTFSLPCWAYFALSDAWRRCATVGKRVLGIRVATADGGRLPPPRALARTAVKLLPWERVLLSAFAFSPVPGAMGPVRLAGLATANLLALAYLAMAVRTRGGRAPEDVVAGTRVERAAASGARAVAFTA